MEPHDRPCGPTGDEQVNTGWWKMKENMDKPVLEKAWEGWSAWHPCMQCSERQGWEKHSSESRTLCREDVFPKGHKKTLRIQKQESHSGGGAETHELGKVCYITAMYFPDKDVSFDIHLVVCRGNLWQLVYGDFNFSPSLIAQQSIRRTKKMTGIKQLCFTAWGL